MVCAFWSCFLLILSFIFFSLYSEFCLFYISSIMVEFYKFKLLPNLAFKLAVLGDDDL